MSLFHFSRHVARPSVALLIGSSAIWALSGPAQASTTSARSLIASAKAAVSAARYVSASSLVTVQGTTYHETGQVGPGEGLQSLSSQGQSWNVEFTKGGLYEKATVGFLQGSFALTTAQATADASKWLEIAPTNVDYKSAIKGLTLSSFLTGLVPNGSERVGANKKIGGVSVQSLVVTIAASPAQPSGVETLYFNAKSHLPVQETLTSVGENGTITYSHWGKVFTISPPKVQVHLH